MRLQIGWANLIVGSKITVFVLFYFVFEGNFPSTSRWGAYIWRGDLTEGFLRHRFGRLILRGAYFRNFTVIQSSVPTEPFTICFVTIKRENLLILLTDSSRMT